MKHVVVGATAFVGLLLVARCGGTGATTCSDSVTPGAPCNDSTLCCPWPGTECGSCQCDGTSFACQMNRCSYTAPCPYEGIVTGQPCGPTTNGCNSHWPPAGSCSSSASIYPCGASCTCSGNAFTTGTWNCTPFACPDAGTDADADAGDAGSDANADAGSAADAGDDSGDAARD